jgi:hypothetical protein
MTTQTIDTTPTSTAEPPAELAEALERISETELVELMRKHCHKSWQATRWLLECKNPQRYGKAMKNAAAEPSAAAVLDAARSVVAEEIADEALRARIQTRLDALAKSKSAEKPCKASPSQACKAEPSAAPCGPSPEKTLAAPQCQGQAVEPPGCSAPSAPLHIPKGYVLGALPEPRCTATDRAAIARLKRREAQNEKHRRQRLKRMNRAP